MGSDIMQPARVYRHLLKAVQKHIGKDGSRRHFSDFVAEGFRQNAVLSDPVVIQHRLKLARNYTFLLNSVHHHKACSELQTSLASGQELLFSYNISVDRSDEMKKILNKSAASVGLQLPDVYQP